MGGCAGCMGPSRRDENYRVNRLTQNSIIKSRVSVQVPVKKTQEKIAEQLNLQKRRLDHSNFLSLTPEMNSSYNKQLKFSPQIYRQSLVQPFKMKQSYQKKSFILPKSVRRVQSSFFTDNYLGLNNSLDFSNEKISSIKNRSTFVYQFQVNHFQKQLSNLPLSQVENINTSNKISFQLKKRSLLGIPQISEEQSRRKPHKIQQEKKKNGEDVLQTGLVGIPNKLQSAPCANLFRYLKDFL